MRALILLLVITGGCLQADIATYTVTPTAGRFLYQFTLTNTGDKGGTLFDLFLSLPSDISNIETATIGTPPGWGDGAGGLLFFGPDVNPSTSFIEWAADFSGAFDLGIGNSLSGFSFTATLSVGTPIRFALNGTTVFADAQPVTAVPEPAAWICLATALVLITCACGRPVQTRIKTEGEPGPRENGWPGEKTARAGSESITGGQKYLDPA